MAVPSPVEKEDNDLGEGLRYYINAKPVVWGYQGRIGQSDTTASIRTDFFQFGLGCDQPIPGDAVGLLLSSEGRRAAIGMGGSFLILADEPNPGETTFFCNGVPVMQMNEAGVSISGQASLDGTYKTGSINRDAVGPLIVVPLNENTLVNNTHANAMFWCNVPGTILWLPNEGDVPPGFVVEILSSVDGCLVAVELGGELFSFGGVESQTQVGIKAPWGKARAFKIAPYLWHITGDLLVGDAINGS